MSSGRFDSNSVLYLAGLKARERGRKLPLKEFECTERLRKQMSALQQEFLVDPCSSPKLKEGAKVTWEKLKREYDAFFRDRHIDSTSMTESGVSVEKRQEIILYSAEKATKNHIHECILHAQALALNTGEKENL